MHSTPTFLLARIITSLILLSIQWYFYRHLRNHYRITDAPRWLSTATTCIFILAIFPLIGILFYQPVYDLFPAWLINAAIVPFYIWHFSLFLVFIMVITGKVLHFPVRILHRFRKPLPPPEPAHDKDLVLQPVSTVDRGRRRFVQQGVTILAGVTLTGNAYGALRRNEYEITEINIPVRGLPGEFVGFTIVLVSDIHSSVFMTKDQMEHYVTVINQTGADCIAVTGDFVNSNVAEVYPFAEAFSQLKAPFGVYGVLGNHDYYTRRIDTLVEEVSQAGISLLVNQNTILRRGSASLNLMGSDDFGSPVMAGRVFDQLLRGTEPDIPKILLCHRPYFFPQAANRSIDLTLSGHTHGGQIVFLRVGQDVLAPARVVSPYVAGLYTLGDSKMYVSRGIGTVGVPIRINCPPEITRITLVGDRIS